MLYSTCCTKFVLHSRSLSLSAQVWFALTSSCAFGLLSLSALGLFAFCNLADDTCEVCDRGLDAAKQFVAYLYSDEACKLFAESGAIQPVLGIADDLDGDNKMFYSIYDNGAKAAMGNFAAFSAIPGVEVRTVFFDPVNSLVSGSMTEQQWIDGIKSASDQMRANIIE